MGGATAAEEETRQASQRKLWNPARRCFPRHVLGWANCCASSSFVLSLSSKVNSQQEHRTFTHWPTGDWVPWTTDMMEEDGPTYYALKHFNENFGFSALSLRNFASRSPESVADHTIVARLILEPRTAISFRQRSTAGDLCIFKGNIEFRRRVAKTTRRLHRSSRREIFIIVQGKLSPIAVYPLVLRETLVEIVLLSYCSVCLSQMESAIVFV